MKPLGVVSTYVEGDLIVCESTAAIVVHLRRVGVGGVKRGGGIDTPFLCLMDRLGGWDLPDHSIEHFLAKVCPPGHCGGCWVSLKAEVG